MPPAATRTITATFAIPSGYTTPNPIVNTATVSSATPPAVPQNATTSTPVATAVTDLQITKTNGVDGVVAGETTTYTITVTNPLGPSDASGATVTDAFPAALTGVTWTCAGAGGGTCPAAGSGVINTSVTVPVGATVVFTATGTINPAATGELVNFAQALPPAGHANRTSAIATDSDPIASRADLGITKTGPATIVAGNDLVYTITVTNTGPSDAAGVVVSDGTPTGLEFVSTTGACTTAFPCALGVVPAGATRTITATFAVPVTYTTPDPIVNIASVATDTSDPVSANNTATVSTAVPRNVDLRVTKTGPASAAPGTAVTYTITVTNAGTSDAIDVVVEDPVPPGLTWTSNTGDCVTAFPCAFELLPAAATRTITATFAIPQDYATTDPIVNTVTVVERHAGHGPSRQHRDRVDRPGAGRGHRADEVGRSAGGRDRRGGPVYRHGDQRRAQRIHRPADPRFAAGGPGVRLRGAHSGHVRPRLRRVDAWRDCGGRERDAHDQRPRDGAGPHREHGRPPGVRPGRS